MPQHEFFCHACKKLFPKVLTLAEYETTNITCPHCGSSDQVEQSWSAFYAITSRKSA
jgi:putative FmdB family regulatory protein